MPTTQSITVPAGTPVYIPSNATVVAVTYSNAAIATSSCTTIPNTPQKCYYFLWDTAANPAFTDAYFSNIILGNIDWAIPAVNQYEDGGGEGLKLATALNSVVNKIWNVFSYDQSAGLGNRGVAMTIADTGSIPQLKIIQGVGIVPTILFLQGIEISCVTPPGWINT